MSDEKYVGPVAAAKNVLLTKAALDKKLDKTGGTITGSLKVDGLINAGNSIDVKGDIDAEGYIHSGLAMLAPTIALNNDAEETSVSIDCSGDNAARITSLGSDGKSRYARLSVGAPTGDNDAATKAYVDAHANVVTYTATNVGEGEYKADGHKTEYQVDFNETTANIIAAIESGEKVILRVDLKELGSNETYPVYFASGYTRADPFTNSAHYVFAGTLGGDQFTLELNSLLTHATLVTYGYILPEPNPDGSDNGKVPIVNGTKWELKALPVYENGDEVRY